MQVRRIAHFNESADVGPAEQRTPRPQPKGLKARFQPIGVTSDMGMIGEGNVSDDDDAEMAEAPTTASKAASKGKKRKEANADKTPRKGKRKHASSEDDAAAAAEQLMTESRTAETKTKKQKTNRSGSPDLGSKPSSATKKQKATAVSALTGQGSLGEPAAASTPPAKVKKAKKPGKSDAPAPSISLPTSKETPTPAYRQTAVPIPFVPNSSAPKMSPVPLPVAALATPVGKVSKSKGRKDKSATTLTRQSPPPSAQGAATNTKDKKVTAIPPPQFQPMA